MVPVGVLLVQIFSPSRKAVTALFWRPAPRSALLVAQLGFVVRPALVGPGHGLVEGTHEGVRIRGLRLPEDRDHGAPHARGAHVGLAQTIALVGVAVLGLVLG